MDLVRPAGVSVRVFGLMGIDDDGVPVSIGGLRQRRLLALLAIRAGSMVDIHWLAEHLWNDEDRPADTARSIRTYVSRLRSAMPEAARGWIKTESGGYRFSAPHESVEHLRFVMLRADATRARAQSDPLSAQKFLDEALNLWSGVPFRELEDLAWARGEIEHLALDRLEAMEERWEVSLALGRHTQITGELAAFTSEHGLRERAAGQYALALHRSGRTAEALREISRHRAELSEESGLEPSSVMVKLEAALLQGDTSLDVDRVGRPLRGYRLLEQAGTGAFSVVWRGVQPSVDREVAIKQIRSELASQPEFIRRFEAEAHLVARIEHPHIVPLIDYWRDPDSAYLVMRWLSGGTLELRLDNGPMTVAETLRLANEIGGALSAAHAHGVVHRDVKSPNILFDDAGNAFLGDFGIALTAQQSSGSEAALSQGSPAYASPEQIRRERLGPSADIFSLGVVLFECLTGFLPFHNSRSVEDLIEQQLQTQFPLVSEWRDDVPTSVVEALAKATAKEADDRFESVPEFLQALAPDTVETSSENLTPGQFDPRLRNPYQGLLAFDSGDASRFFGREGLVDELVGRLGGQTLRSRCLVVVGPSGSGKSSVVRAGLVPAIRAGSVSGSEDWFITTLLPGTDPFESLEVALLRIAVNPPPSLVGQLRNGSRGILRGVRRCLSSDDDRLLIVIDQFEELFTSASTEDANSFLEALSIAVEDPTSPVRLVITLRADYYHRPLEHPTFARVLKETAVEVTPLAGNEMERAIVEPARRVGVEFEPGLPARMAAEAVSQPSPLPLLQYTLSELFESRVGNQLTAGVYEEIGGLSGALSARAEGLYTSADEPHRRALRRLLGRMVSPESKSADLRRRVFVADLDHDPSTTSVLDSLDAARLVTFDRDAATREPTVEVAHEALLREWPRLVRWLEEDADLLRSAAAIAAAATVWDQGGRELPDLYRGGRLENAVVLVGVDADRLRPIDREFIEASTHAAETDRDHAERSVRRLRRLVVGVGMALVMAVVAGGIALHQRNDAQAATTEAELAVLVSQSAAVTDPKLAVLLALEAQRRAPGADSDQAVLAALGRSPGVSTIASFPALAEGFCGWEGWVAKDGLTMSSLVNGVMVTRDFETGEIVEYGPIPGGECGTWFGDHTSNQRYAVSGDRLYLGPLDGPWEVDVQIDEFERLPGPVAFGAERLILESPNAVRILSSTSGEAVGVPIAGLTSPFARFSGDEERVAVVSSVAATDGTDNSILMVLDADTGAELIRSEVPGKILDLSFDSTTNELLASTASSRLLTIDLATGGLIHNVGFNGDESYNLGVRQDGAVAVISTGSPGRIEIVDRVTGPIGDSLELRNFAGGILRSDDNFLAWDFTFQVDVLDLDGDPLVDRRLAYDALEGNFGDANTVQFDSGRVVVTNERTGKTEIVDLENGTRATANLRTLDGSRFPSAVGTIAFPGGLWQLSEDLEIAVWEDGKMVARRKVATATDVTFDGFAASESRVAVGGLRPDGTTEVHLLEVGGGEIRLLSTIEMGDVATAFPPETGGLIVLGKEGILRTYGASGEQIDEFDTGLIAISDLVHDNKAHIAFAAQESSQGVGAVSIVDLDDHTVRRLPTFGEVQNMSFARDGEILVIQSNDGAVNLWDVTADSFTGTIWTGTGTGLGAPWYDDATDSIWVASSNELVRLPLDPVIWAEQACRVASRDLTQQEWDRFVPGGGAVQSACG